MCVCVCLCVCVHVCIHVHMHTDMEARGQPQVSFLGTPLNHCLSLAWNSPIIWAATLGWQDMLFDLLVSAESHSVV